MITLDVEKMHMLFLISDGDADSASLSQEGAVDPSTGHACSPPIVFQKNRRQFNRAPSFTQHYLATRLPGLLQCRICEEAVPNLTVLSQHMHQCHGQTERYVCPVCGNIYQTITGLKNHVQKHEGKVYPCKLCGATFTRKGTMVRHRRTIHNSDYYMEEKH